MSAPAPRVSVVIPVHDCLPYLEQALASVHHQTLRREQVEVVAVDDGSTDGSSELLASWAARWPQLRVHTQEASGAAGRPRNVGIELARGDFVFFLDGDDCLGPEALERLVAYADEHGSDVVLAHIVGVGRPVGVPVLQQDLPRADLTSGVYYTLMPFKLVRRRLLVEHGIRFPEHLRISEDQPFVAECYLRASVISVLGSYPAYYLVRREDGSNTSAEGLPFAQVLAQADEVVQLVLRHTEPGPVQAHLVGRHVGVEMLRKIADRLLVADEAGRRELVETAAPWAERWQVPGLDDVLSVAQRLMLRAVRDRDVERLVQVVRWSRHGTRSPILARDDRWYLAGPGWGDLPAQLYLLGGPPPVRHVVETAALDAEALHLTGHAFLLGVASTRTTTTLVARHKRSGHELRVPVRRRPSPHVTAVEGGAEVGYDEAGYAVDLPLAELLDRPGRWRLALEVASPETTGRSPAGLPPVLAAEPVEVPHADGPTRLRLDEGASRNLVLDVVRDPVPEPHGRLDRVRGLIPGAGPRDAAARRRTR